MAKHSYYFTHDFGAHDDEKIIDLRMNYGLEGYGAYWFIIELLASTDGYQMEINHNRVAFTIGSNADLVSSIIEKSGLFIVSDGMFYSESLTVRLNRLDEIKRKRAEAGAKGGKVTSKAKQSLSIATPLLEQKEAKERKGKERKEDESKEKNKKNPLTPKGDVPELFKEFQKMYKGTKRGCLTEWENFRKKHKDAKSILPTLKVLLESQTLARSKLKFIPQWPNLATYINQRRWEEEYSEIEEPLRKESRDEELDRLIAEEYEK